MAAGAHLIVVGVLADQVHPTGRGDDDRAVSSKVLRKERLRAGNVRGQLHVWMADVVTGRFPSKSNPSIQGTSTTHSLSTCPPNSKSLCDVMRWRVYGAKGS